MGGKRQHIHSELFNVYRHFSGGRHGVAQKTGAVFFCLADKFRHRLDHAGFVIYEHKRSEIESAHLFNRAGEPFGADRAVRLGRHF
ncbi:MAG: hypothetical protein BWY32_03825 [bacterium ADurb.Bin243]|nr:MAG: hypothetical protein BWY32_03825 [bacterium ADurb.Bin243]